MKKVLLFGASGMLGHGVHSVLSEQLRLIPSARKDRYTQADFRAIDLCDVDSVKKLIQHEKPDEVLYGAGIISKLDCDQDRVSTRQVHSETPALIASILRDYGGRLTYISSESVYGNHDGAYTETSATSPMSFYAETKLRGEEQSLASNPNSLVLRVTPVGLTPDLGRGTFAEWAIKSMQSGQSIKGFDHHYFTPVGSTQLANLIQQAWEQNLMGVYNVGCDTPLSKYDFMVELQSRCTRLSERGRISIAETSDDRPHFGNMISDKFFTALGGVPPSSQQVVQSVLDQYVY